MLNNPLLVMMRQREIAPWQRKLGFTRTPYSLSPLGTRQLLAIFQGEASVPDRLWSYCYLGVPHVPDAAQRSFLSTLDFVFIELSALAEYRVGPVVLNARRIRDMAARIAAMPDVPKGAADIWLDRLGSAEPGARRDAAKAILNVYPRDTPEHEVEREIIAELRIRNSRLTDIGDTLVMIREAFPQARVAVVLFHFCYMSGARAIDWPPELNRHAIAATRDLKMPVFDPAGLVRQYGNDVALDEDQRHWAPAFNAVVGRSLVDFARAHAAGR